MADRDLKLNSLSRYSKQSPSYVLEEHGHCEVPAGCGGVVLRWRNPNRAIPVELWMASRGQVSLYLDGASPRSGRPLVTPGQHVLAFTASQIQPDSGVLMLAAVYDEDDMIHTSLSRKTGVKIRILSAGDGSWKYSVREPADDSWMLLGFDDSGWHAMVRHDLPTAGEDDRYRESYRERKLREFGACGLGVTEKTDRIWIRKVINLGRP
jgi:hypothetical protein